MHKKGEWDILWQEIGVQLERSIGGGLKGIYMPAETTLAPAEKIWGDSGKFINKSNLYLYIVYRSRDA